MNEIEVRLSQVPLFASLPPAELAHLAGTLRPVALEPGVVIMTEGAVGQHFYVVLEGQLEVVKALGAEAERFVGLRGPGEFLGELSLLSGSGLRTATVRARTAARVLEMTRADFDALLHRYPLLAYEMVRVLGARLTAAQERAVADLLEKHHQLEAAYTALQAAQAQVIEKEKLERELELARDIQMSILPRTLPEAPGYRFGALMRPARLVGGDLFDFVPLEGQRLGLVVGDVSGKGVPAAIFMAQARALLRAEASRGAPPREVLECANRHLLGMNDAGLFVTVLYGVLDFAAGCLHYARAGHERPLVVSAAGQIEPARRARGQPLGVFDDAVLDEQTVDLPPGSALLLYTDGATDARDAAGEAFGQARLGQALVAAVAGRAPRLCAAVLQAVLAHQGASEQHDDITLLTVQAAPPAGG